MNYSENLRHFRCLLLIFAVGLLTAVAPAQTVSQNAGLSQEIKETKNINETLGEKDKGKILEDKAAEKSKQDPPKPPRFGGHVGVVIPIVTRGNGTTTTIADDFSIGFPFCLTVKTNSPVAFDFEFIPTVNRSSNQDFRFLVHPGVIYNFKKKYTVGLRGAFEVGTGNYGFTPLVARSFKLKGRTNFFVEADFPVRWERQANSPRFASVGFAAHSGINF